jgi:hypothetical protein
MAAGVVVALAAVAAESRGAPGERSPDQPPAGGTSRGLVIAGPDVLGRAVCWQVLRRFHKDGRGVRWANKVCVDRYGAGWTACDMTFVVISVRTKPSISSKRIVPCAYVTYTITSKVEGGPGPRKAVEKIRGYIPYSFDYPEGDVAFARYDLPRGNHVQYKGRFEWRCRREGVARKEGPLTATPDWERMPEGETLVSGESRGHVPTSKKHLQPVRDRFEAFARTRAKKIAREYSNDGIDVTVKPTVHDILQMGHSAREVYGEMGDWPAVVDGRMTKKGKLALPRDDRQLGKPQPPRSTDAGVESDADVEVNE